MPILISQMKELKHRLVDNLPKVTQLGRSKARTQPQAVRPIISAAPPSVVAVTSVLARGLPPSSEVPSAEVRSQLEPPGGCMWESLPDGSCQQMLSSEMVIFIPPPPTLTRSWS